MEFPRLVFEKVFSDDIHRLLSMEDMWKSRKPPKPLQYDSLKELTASLDAQQVAQQDQRAWRIEESLAVFTDRYADTELIERSETDLASIWRLSDRFEKGRTESSTSSSAPVITFDKDDMDTLDFVAASANIRSEIFGIEPKSKFEVKSNQSRFQILDNLLTKDRNGRKHHPCNSHHERRDCRSLRLASF